jgi:hypothetical protein
MGQGAETERPSGMSAIDGADGGARQHVGRGEHRSNARSADTGSNITSRGFPNHRRLIPRISQCRLVLQLVASSGRGRVVPSRKERPVSDQPFQRSWWPTRKWWVGLVTAGAALATNILQADHWSRDFGVAIVTVVAGAITSYLTPNSDNPGGYEAKRTPQGSANLTSTSTLTPRAG